MGKSTFSCHLNMQQSSCVAFSNSSLTTNASTNLSCCRLRFWLLLIGHPSRLGMKTSFVFPSSAWRPAQKSAMTTAVETTGFHLLWRVCSGSNVICMDLLMLENIPQRATWKSTVPTVVVASSGRRVAMWTETALQLLLISLHNFCLLRLLLFNDYWYICFSYNQKTLSTV